VSKKKRKKPGPKPVIVKIEGDWVDALKRVLHIKRPKKWPQVPDPDLIEADDDGQDKQGDIEKTPCLSTDTYSRKIEAPLGERGLDRISFGGVGFPRRGDLNSATNRGRFPYGDATSTKPLLSILTGSPPSGRCPMIGETQLARPL